MIPATAGRVIKEQELRAFTKCSQLFHYGGKVEAPLLTSIVQSTLEVLIVDCVREETLLSPDFSTALRRAFTVMKIKENLQDAEADKLFRNSVYALNDVVTQLCALELVGIMGPFEQRVKISRTPIDLKYSGLLRKQKTQELVIPVFMPTLGDHAVLNDPVLQLKVNSIKQFGKPHGKRPTVSAYVYTTKNDGKINFYYLNDKELVTSRLQMIETQIKAMELGYHFPILPCPHACPFKGRCFPEKE